VQNTPLEEVIMDTPSISDELRRYLALFWHFAWILVLCTGLAMVVALLVSLRTTPVYQATTRVLINEAPATKGTDYTSVLTSERTAQTYAQLLTSESVLSSVAMTMSLDLSPAQLKRMILVEPVRDTQLIELKANDTDPNRATLILNTLVTQFIRINSVLQGQRFETTKTSLNTQMASLEDRINALTDELEGLGSSSVDESKRSRIELSLTQYRQIYSSLLLSFEQVRLAEAQSTSSLVQVDKATPPSRPIRPRTVTNVALAGIIGFLIGAGIIFLIEAFDDTLKGPDDVARHLGLPVLGLIAKHDKDVKVITAAQPRSPISEAYRSLRTNLQFTSVDYPINTLLITSPSPGEGKSSVTANLGIVMAQSGRSVVLIDADLRRPNLHKILELSNRKGISTLFVQPKLSLDGSLQPTAVPNLYVLPAGEVPPNPSELLGSAKMFEIIGRVKDHADLVIIDTPPIMAVTDSAVLAPRVDGVILVVRPGSTNLGAAKQAVEQLRRVGANLLGVVFNEVAINRSRYRYYRYKGYYYHYYNTKYYHEDSEKNGNGSKDKVVLGAKNGKNDQPENKNGS
jgi:succinoglycan biosynthesis transport protein ExoP